MPVHRRTTLALTLAGILAVTLSLPRALDAQPARGFRVGVAPSYAWTRVSDATAAATLGAGERIGGGAGARADVGYDHGRFGATLALDLAEAPLGGRPGSSLGIALLAHWWPAAAVAGWQPHVGAGYVRAALANADMSPSALAPGLRERLLLLPDDRAPRPLSLLGNGLRLALGVERPLAGRFALTAEVAADLVAVGSASYDGAEYRVDDGGWSAVPRVSVGVRRRWR